ncbi:hypothetical protein GpartN1_g815.t1 [Galdieria partita]|uniref:Spindle pole body component n=1 Tax=Galdieria partita TaxID=83374 RepID=A0A9C7UMV1_9RHOD|nr:hypothetical protein GpartN1_g815.t1 [Galdieria partita]
MWPYAAHSHQRPRNNKLHSEDLQERKIGIYGSLKFLSKKFSQGQPFYKTLARFYEVSLNLNGLLNKEAYNYEEAAERVSEVVFVLGTLGVSDIKTKRLEGLCDKLLLKDDIAVSLLILLLQLTNYETLQQREQESSLERFFERKAHRRTITLSKDTFRKEELSNLVKEPRDLSKFYWKHNRKLSLQLDAFAESTGESVEMKDLTGSSAGFLSPRSQTHRKNAFMSRSNGYVTRDAGQEVDKKQDMEGTSTTPPKSIFDFTEKTYQALYHKHFGSRSKSWIPPNHPLIFESAIWSLISNVSFLIRKNPLGGFEPVASRLQPCARSILGEFGAIATELFEMNRTISRLRENSNPILLGFAKALRDEIDRYSNNVLPLITTIRYKVYLDEQENLPIFGLIQQIRKVAIQLHECVAIMKFIMPYEETDPCQLLLGLYHYQKEHLELDKKDSLGERLFLKVLVPYLFSLRRIALYGSQFCFDNDDNTALVPQLTVKLFENMLPMKVKFMVDKAAYGVDILWSINPQHPFFSSNREALCTVPSVDSIDINSIEQQVEEHFNGISKELLESCISKKAQHHQNSFIYRKPHEDESLIEVEDASKKVELSHSDDELSWLSSESDDSTEPVKVSRGHAMELLPLESNKHNCIMNKSLNIYSANVLSLWESSVCFKDKLTHLECESVDTPFDKFVSELALSCIRGIYYHVQQYLWWVMEEEIEIFDHFRAVRDYLLLNRGDFFLELCQSVYNISCSEWFMGGTEAEARLQLAFEQAILSSSASWDPRIRYFGFLMDKDGNTDYNTHVYSQILLQWKPSNLVEASLFESSTLEVYSHIFHFAFKLKSASYLLRQLYVSISHFPSYWQGVQRKAHILRFQLMQFINALLQFYDHGLLEGNWFRFLREAKKSNDIWELRNLHLQFLDEALSYIFGNQNPLASDVNRILGEIINFELDTRKALRHSNVSNISMLGRRIEVLSSMLSQFYDKMLLLDKKSKMISTEWIILMTYFGIKGE